MYLLNLRKPGTKQLLQDGEFFLNKSRKYLETCLLPLLILQLKPLIKVLCYFAFLPFLTDRSNALERTFLYIKTNYILINRKHTPWLLECVENVSHAFHAAVVLSKESGELGTEGLPPLEGPESALCSCLSSLGLFTSTMGNSQALQSNRERVTLELQHSTAMGIRKWSLFDGI